MDEPIAGVFGVLKMESYVFFAGEGNGDAALRIVGVGFAEGFLRDDKHFAVASQFNGGA